MNENGLTVQELIVSIADRPVVKLVNMQVPVLQKWAIIGETGSGKTSLLKAVAGLMQPTAGELRWKNERIEGPEEKLIPGHPKIAYLSQYFELRNNYYVYELLEYANELTTESASALYTVCQINHLLPRRTNALSGGERQRVALALLLSKEPQLLLLDEPFSNLDLSHKMAMREVLDEVSRRWKLTSIMASHDSTDTLSWADRLLVMRDGVIVQEGSPEEIYYFPESTYAAGLLGVYNLVSASVSGALFSRAGAFEQGKQLFSRPDQLMMLPGHSGHGMPGVVQQIYFQGSHILARINARNHDLWAVAVKGQVVEGDAVRLLYAGERPWYL